MAHLAEWRVWLEEFAAELCPQDQLPVAVASYSITQDELPGAVLHWTDHYLSSKKCPRPLRAALCRQAVREVTASVTAEPHTAGYAEQQRHFVPLKCMQAVVRRVDELCLRYLDNAALDALPPPPTPRHHFAMSASAAHKNSRRAMEDRYVDIPCLEHLLGEVPANEEERTSVYAVYDGHQGAAAAIYCCVHLHQFLHDSAHFRTDLPAALVDAFRRTDAQFTSKERGNGGSTAVVVVRRGPHLVVAWAGDSKAMLVRRSSYLPLVKPHKPNRSDESARINQLGGCVLFCGTWRVNGHLAVSRSIGDRDLKPCVSAEPEILEVELTGDELMVVVASDGLWDVFREGDVVHLARDLLLRTPAPPHDEARLIAEGLVTAARKAGSSDNVSVVTALLRRPDEVRERLARADLAMERDTSAAPDTDDDDLGPETPVDQDIEEPRPTECAVEADNVAESGEDSDDEWNYFQGEQQQAPAQKQPEGAWEEDEESSEMNSSPLNPEAPVFVPGGADSPLLGDHLIAESPRKPLPIDDVEPDCTLFANEAGHRPASPADNLDQILHLNGDNKLLLEGMERVQRDTTLLCEVGPATPLAAHVDQQLLERLQSKERDPMSMSFYGEREEEPPSELDHVQQLPDSEDDEPESHKLLFEQIPETPHGKILPNASVEFVAGFAQLLTDPISNPNLIPDLKDSIPGPTSLGLASKDHATDQIDFMLGSKDQDPKKIQEAKDNGPDFLQLEKPYDKESSDFLTGTKDFTSTNLESENKNPFNESAQQEIEAQVSLPEMAKLEPQLSEAVQESTNFVIEAIESEPKNLIDQLSELSLEPKQPVSESPGFTNHELNEIVQEQSDDEPKGMAEFYDIRNQSEEIAPGAFIELELSAKSVIMTPEPVEAVSKSIEPSAEPPQAEDIPETESVPQYDEEMFEPTTPVKSTSEPTNILDEPSEFVPKDHMEFGPETLFGIQHADIKLESMESAHKMKQEHAETLSEPANLIGESSNLADESADHGPSTNGFLHEITEHETEQKNPITESEKNTSKTKVLSEYVPESSVPTPETIDLAPEPIEPAPEPSGPAPEPSEPAPEPSEFAPEPEIPLIPKSTNVLSEFSDVPSMPVELIAEVSLPVSAEPQKAEIPVIKESPESISESNAADVGVIVAGLAATTTAAAIVAAKTTPSTTKSSPAAKSVPKAPVSKTPVSKTSTSKVATPATKAATPVSKPGTPAAKSTTPTTKPKVTSAISKPTNLAIKSTLAPKTSAAATKTAPTSKPATALTKTTTKISTAASKPASGASRLSTTASKPTTATSKPANAATKTPAAPRPATAALKPTSATTRATPAVPKPTTVAPKTVAPKIPAAPKPALAALKPLATASKLTGVASKTTSTTVASKTTSVASKTTTVTSRATTATAKTTAMAPKTAPGLKNGPARPASASAKRLTNGDAKSVSKTTAMPPPIRRQTGDKSSKELANKRLSASAEPEKSAEDVSADAARAPSPLLPDVVA